MKDNGSLRTIAMENCALFVDSGYSRALYLVTTDDKIDMVQTVTLHHVLLRSLAEVDQFAKGLQELGVLDAIRKYPEVMKPFFTKDGIQHLTAGSHIFSQ